MWWRSVAIAVVTVLPSALAAQDPAPRRDTSQVLPEIRVQARRRDTTGVPAMQRFTLPATASVTAQALRTSVNLVDAQDAVRYMPSMFVRKRNNGDTQSTLGTRSWGVGSSARSLVFADGVPLTALIANNNTIGGPRWGLVSPEEIRRVDVMTGPFSAAYGGGSIGAVVEITTRQPERFEGSISQTVAAQRFSLYGTSDTYTTAQTGIHVGDRVGKFSFWLSGNYASSESQPLAYVTPGTNPNGTTGGYADRNKLGAPVSVAGATGLQQTDMLNGRVKLAYDVASDIRLAYSLGVWHNRGSADVASYLAGAGTPTFGGLAGFATGRSEADQTHAAHSVSLRTDGTRAWEFDVTASLYRFMTDRLRTPASAAATGETFSTAGRTADMDGTGWATLDARAAWRGRGSSPSHAVSFGVHADRYALRNPTFNVPDWTVGSEETATGVATRGDGTTRTLALWMQDRVRLARTLHMTVGGRIEAWKAYDGINVNGATTVKQPTVSATRFSPKASATWDPSAAWSVAASIGKAYRFATPAELYQLVSTGTTFTSPDPNLKPDNVLATELRIERRWDHARGRVSLFHDDTRDAIISQFLPLAPNSTTLYSYLANVDHIRARGIELGVSTTGFGVRALDLSGSVTWLDTEILAISGRAGASAPEGSALGKQVPNVPEWRATGAATYRVGTKVTLAAGVRYSSKLYTTLDNADVNPNTYAGFGSWIVADARLTVRPTARIEAALGVDNLNNRKYFLFHPFPQRTLVASVRYGM